MSRIFAISDLHVDIKQNYQQLSALSNSEYRHDVLIVAGDVTDSLPLLEQTFLVLLKKFKHVAFVPGNHELWIRNQQFADSIEKFLAVVALCRSLGVVIKPLLVESSQSAVWLVPLFSWYRYPEEGKESLFIEKVGENWEQCGWVDKVLCRWPQALLKKHESPSDYFLTLNKPALETEYQHPIISFSHFLPRKELMFSDPQRGKYFANGGAAIENHPQDPHPLFNFSRVAGCQKLDQQIHFLKSRVHIYGHQHRNRLQKIEGVTYLSHCLGTGVEQRRLGYSCMPLVIWDDGQWSIS